MTVDLSRTSASIDSTDAVRSLQEDITRHIKYSLGRDGHELSEAERT